MSDSKIGLNAEEWGEKLRLISENLEHPALICLIGSGVGMLAQQDRISIDLDFWRRSSKFAHSDLKQAVEKAGLLFDPKDEMDPDTPYIQIVEQGVVQLGKFDTTETVLDEQKLKIVRPPIQNIIASKLLRASPKDLEDISYLKHHFGVSSEVIKDVISTFPAGDTRDRAMENTVYLDVLPEPTEPRGAAGFEPDL